ncbi:MAG: hypothetical protein M1826_003909 [Phylliscum demangeonii]|nr:MAG: hypothetical protein M1826_003909 [Phylliscum demangeonii]
MQLPLAAILSTLCIVGTAAADVLDDSLSFGHRSPRKNPVAYRDGSLKAFPVHQQFMQQAEWTVEFQFRATGPERGGGNLQLWYTKDSHSTSSIYTVGRFDGLVLVVDTYGGQGGSIRGFLNDGQTEYKDIHNVDSLVFGHCRYAYRNLGRLTKLQVKHTATALEVTVDEKACFRSDKIQLPTNHRFGVSAASAETPDAFEAFKFLVRASGAGAGAAAEAHALPAVPAPGPHAGSDSSGHAAALPSSGGSVDEPLRALQTQLSSVALDLSKMHATLHELMATATGRHHELLSSSPSHSHDDTAHQVLALLAPRLAALETQLHAIEREVGDGRDAHQLHLHDLHDTLHDQHSTLMTHLPHTVLHALTTRAPRFAPAAAAYLALILVLVQIALAAAYMLYRRKRAEGAKKFL